MTNEEASAVCEINAYLDRLDPQRVDEKPLPRRTSISYLELNGVPILHCLRCTGSSSETCKRAK